jgi:hypothetical protein
MPTFDEINELIALAEKRAATEVETWIPEKPGDKISGTVVEIGSITTKYGDYATTTITPHGRPDDLVRVAWMGAVLKAQYLRMRPAPDDIVAFHYQKDVAPQNGMNDYALIVAVVLDYRTGKAKMPVDLSVIVPTTEQIVTADPRTGEIASFTHVDPLAPVPGEEPL